MPKIYPSLENIARLKVQPTEGESYLLNYLNEHLDDSFDVFFNPFLDGDRPDFIILKKYVAIFIIEVKDYKLDNYFIDHLSKWSVRSNQGTSRISSPQAQAFTYKKNLYQLHSPILGLNNLENHNFFKIVTPLVYLHRGDKRKIDDLYINAEDNINKSKTELNVKHRENRISHNEYNRQADHISTINKNLTRDKSMLFGHDRVKSLVEKLNSCKAHVLFDERIYDELKRRLMPSEHVLKQGKAIPLDDKQLKVAISTQGKEKIKGVAGCGKTTIIAHRAIDAHLRHKQRVLILTFNITLKNLIKDKISDVLGHRDEQNFAVTNYHQFFNSQLNATEQDIRAVSYTHLTLPTKA